MKPRKKQASHRQHESKKEGGSEEDRAFDLLLKVYSDFCMEAEKCYHAEAYLAGCIMLGAALEAILLCLLDAFRENLAQWQNSSPETHAAKGLGKILDTVWEHGWMPSDTHTVELWGGRFVSFEECATQLRHIRNLIHPGAHLRRGRCEWPDRQTFVDCYNTIVRAHKHVGTAIDDDLDQMAAMLIAIQKSAGKRFGMTFPKLPRSILRRVQQSSDKKEAKDQAGPFLFPL